MDHRTDGERPGRAKTGMPAARAVLVVAAGVWIGLRAEDAILPAVLPLALAAVAARLVSPTADAVSRAFHIGRKTAGAVFSVTVCALALWLLGLLGTRAAAELETVAAKLPEWIASAAEKAEEMRARLPFLPESETDGIPLAPLLTRAAGSLAEWFAGVVGRAVQGFPGGVLSLAVGAVSFVYLTADPAGARASLGRLFRRIRPGSGDGPEFAFPYEGAWDAVARYLRAVFALSAVTFGELLAGFWLLKIENAPAIALLTAAVDLLPLFGCGTVLTPWAVAAFLSGQGGTAAGLLALLAAVWITRQLLEPKLVGRAAGVHPFFALAATYLGLKFFGLSGMIAAPVLLGVAGEIARARKEGPE